LENLNVNINGKHFPFEGPRSQNTSEIKHIFHKIFKDQIFSVHQLLTDVTKIKTIRDYYFNKYNAEHNNELIGRRTYDESKVFPIRELIKPSSRKLQLLIKRIFFLVVFYDLNLRKGVSDEEFQKILDIAWKKDFDELLNSITIEKNRLSALNYSSDNNNSAVLKVFNDPTLKAHIGNLSKHQYYNKYLKYKNKYLMLKNTFQKK